MKQKSSDSKKPLNGFSRFIGGKGFYIALLLCAGIVGTTTYLSVKNSFDINEPYSQSKDNASDETTPKEETIQPTEKPETDITAPSQTKDSAPQVKTAEPKKAENQNNAATAKSDTKKTTTPKTETTATYFTMPVEGEIVKDYSGDVLVFSNTMQDYRTHTGVDIGAAVGTPVKACAEGQIINIYNDELGGTTVVIQHKDNIVSRYSNLSPDLPAGVAVGEQVAGGDTIGAVGQSMLSEVSEASHLHFEMLKNDEYIDPIKKLKS
ncbi:MAG: M23 family metallopeptidase [Bacillota bacterium]|nr:M23 family metallopeptidase [Bacillota bacterium]